MDRQHVQAHVHAITMIELPCSANCGEDVAAFAIFLPSLSSHCVVWLITLGHTHLLCCTPVLLYHASHYVFAAPHSAELVKQPMLLTCFSPSDPIDDHPDADTSSHDGITTLVQCPPFKLDLLRALETESGSDH